MWWTIISSVFMMDPLGYGALSTVCWEVIFLIDRKHSLLWSRSSGQGTVDGKQPWTLSGLQVCLDEELNIIHLGFAVRMFTGSNNITNLSKVKRKTFCRMAFYFHSKKYSILFYFMFSFSFFLHSRNLLVVKYNIHK